jgi:hypothetical protein
MAFPEDALAEALRGFSFPLEPFLADTSKYLNI